MYHVYNSLGLYNSGTTHSHQDTAATAESALDFGCKWNLQPGYLELQPDQQQNNAWDCHIFLVTAASAWLRGNDLPRQRDMDACRARWMHVFAEHYGAWKKEESVPTGLTPSTLRRSPRDRTLGCFRCTRFGLHCDKASPCTPSARNIQVPSNQVTLRVPIPMKFTISSLGTFKSPTD